MVDGRQLKKAIDKFMQSPVCLDARVQIELPNGEMYDLTTMTMLDRDWETTIKAIKDKYPKP